MSQYQFPKLNKKLEFVINDSLQVCHKRINSEDSISWTQNEVVLDGAYGNKGPFSLDGCNYLLEPLKAMTSWKTNLAVIIKAVQTFGTGIVEMFLYWSICNRPMDTLWVHCQKEDASEKMMNTRLKPTMLATKAISPYLPVDKRKIRKDGIHFPHMLFTICGPSETNLQSTSYGNVILDELAFNEHGDVYKHASARTTYYEEKGLAKVIVVSQAGDADGQLEKLWRDTTQEEWNVPCPECKAYFVPYITQLNANGKPWNDPSLGLKDNKENYDFGRLEEMLTLECPHCKHLMKDGPKLKRYWNDNGKYIAGNPKPVKGQRGFRWNCLHREIPWIKIVHIFITACRNKKNGDPTDFCDFFRKYMARPVKPEDFMIGNKHLKTDVPYDKNQWPDEHIRIFTLDVQEHHFVGVIRAWAKDGRSRLLWTGRLMSIDDVLHKQQEFNIPYFMSYGKKTYYIAWDTGYGNRTREVYNYIIKYNHIGLKGKVSQQGFVTKYFSEKYKRNITHYDIFKKSVTGGDPNIGTPLANRGPKAELYLIATDTLKKALTLLVEGKGSEWLCLPMTEPFMEEYKKSILGSEWADIVERNGERQVVWKKTSHEACNDYWDAEVYNLAVAAMAGITIEEIKNLPTLDYMAASTSTNIDETAITKEESIT